MKRWFISDTHFSHKNIIKHADRPYTTVEEMNRSLIDNWNQCVKAEDQLVLAVEKVADKKVEKNCLPVILEQVNVKGSIISGDAHFTNPMAAEQIVDADADYLLAVKGNQPKLQAEMENFFFKHMRLTGKVLSI